MDVSSSDKQRYAAVLVVLLLLGAQWIFMFFAYGHTLHLPWVPILPGIAIFAAAYLLSWSAEIAQKDVSPSLALGLLALVAVLPEYAVDLYFAWRGGQDETYIPFATANMTGANRLLIGVGWPAVLLVFAWFAKKKSVSLDRRLRLEVGALAAATLYALFLPWKGTLAWYDAVVLVGCFLWYFFGLLKGEVREPELEGPAEWMATWPTPIRRAAAIFLFVYAGFLIFISAEPFAEGILEAGRVLGIEEFILVQWLAPLASESPEFIVAILYAARLKATDSMNTLVSSKVNQWTLLVGMLPVAFLLSSMLSGGGFRPMVLDGRQQEEIFLTAAQSLFALVLIADFRFSVKEALWLFVLFFAQAAYPLVENRVGMDAVHVRWGFAWLYILLSFGLLVRRPKIGKEIGEALKVYRKFGRT